MVFCFIGEIHLCFFSTDLPCHLIYSPTPPCPFNLSSDTLLNFPPKHKKRPFLAIKIHYVANTSFKKRASMYLFCGFSIIPLATWHIIHLPQSKRPYIHFSLEMFPMQTVLYSPLGFTFTT